MNEAVMEVREMRNKISEKCGLDLNRLLAYYQKVGEKMRKSGKYKFVDSRTACREPGRCGLVISHPVKLQIKG